MKKLLTFLFGLGLFVLPSVTFASCSPVALGGTGWCTFQSGTGALLYGNGTSPIATTSAGTLGYVLQFNGSIPLWVSTTTLGFPAAGTGTVTSVGASTPNSTLTLGGTNPITTTGTISFDLNLSHPNYWTALQNFTNASTSQLTATSSVWLTSLATSAGTFLAVDPNGKVIATTTPSGSNSAFSPSANYASTTTIPSYTYTTGVITAVGNGALFIDGNSPSVGQRILLKNENGSCTSSSGACNNGLYDVTAAGSAISAFVLTRDPQYNSSSNVIPGIITYVISGTVNNDDFWAMTSAAPITVGTTALNYIEVSGGGASVTTVSNSDGTLTISPTAGAVVASLALGHPNTWTGLQNFNNATSTLFSSGTSWFTSNTGVVLSTDANGKLQNTTISSPLQFSGTTLSCPTCSTTAGTVTSITGGNGLNGGTITSSGTLSLKSYLSTSSADTIGYVPFWATTNGTPAQLADNSTFNFTTASNLLTFTNGSSTAFTVSNYLGIPASSNPSPTINGSLTQSTNAPYQLHLGGGGTTIVYDPQPAFTITVASTTALIGTTTSPVFVIPKSLTVTNWLCTAQPGGATAEVAWSYANPSAYINVAPNYLAASSTPGIVSISTNNTPTRQATTTVAVGAITGSATSVSCGFYGNNTAI